METQQLQYKLSAFEGPLDLLLTLISKNKIDIYDISISELLDQYMEQINMMQENQMDIASEFLTMASRLVYIKSVMLLPKYEEEAEELKKELSGQLLEYAVCREMAAKLGDIYDFDSFYREASPVEFDLTYNRIHPSEDIAKAYVSAVGRGKRKLPPSKDAFSGIVFVLVNLWQRHCVFILNHMNNGIFTAALNSDTLALYQLQRCKKCCHRLTRTKTMKMRRCSNGC